MNSTPKQVKEQAISTAIAYIKKKEGCKLEAYPDPMYGEKIPTIGFGRTAGVKMGDVTTLDIETEHLKKYVTKLIEQIMGSLVLNSLTFSHYAQVEWRKLNMVLGPNQLAAIASLAYNIGFTGWLNSSVRREILARRLENIRPAWMMWNKSNGQVSKGLINRREDEYNLFMKGVTVIRLNSTNVRVRS